jgi:GGDEF domain-containing protein
VPRASVGLAVFPEDAADAEALLRAADAAMYGAKRGARDAGARAARRNFPRGAAAPLDGFRARFTLDRPVEAIRRTGAEGQL